MKATPAKLDSVLQVLRGSSFDIDDQEHTHYILNLPRALRILD